MDIAIPYRGYSIRQGIEYAFIYHNGKLIDSIRHGKFEDAARVIDGWHHAV